MEYTQNENVENVIKLTEKKVNSLESRLKNIQSFYDKLDKTRKQEYLMKMNLLKEHSKTYQKMLYYSRFLNIIFILAIIAILIISITYCNSIAVAMDNVDSNYTALLRDYEKLEENIIELENTLNETGVDLESIRSKVVASKEEAEEPVKINTTDITKPSNLTAEQLNTIIDAQLSHIGQGETKFSNMGEALVKMEKESDVNALFCLAVGSLESGHGTSSAARNRNNLFGLIGRNGLMKFGSVEECVLYWGELIRNNYIDSGRTTVESIQSKYCPGSSTWSDNINHFIKTYANHVNF